MEDHLKNKDRLSVEWEGLCAYEAEPNSITVSMETANMRKNRYSDVLPCKLNANDFVPQAQMLYLDVVSTVALHSLKNTRHIKVIQQVAPFSCKPTTSYLAPQAQMSYLYLFCMLLLHTGERGHIVTTTYNFSALISTSQNLSSVACSSGNHKS